MSRGKVEVRDPAAAIAMAKCWLSTWTRRMEAGGNSSMPWKTSDFHPDACVFCDEPRDLLIQMLEEFQAWSQISETDVPGEERPLKLEIEAWETLPSTEQTLRVRRVQGFVQPDRGRTVEDRRNPW